MDAGTLSQDEINALLNGMDAIGGGDASPDGLEGAGVSGTEASFGNEELTDVEKDAIGEVANISINI